MNVKKEPIPVRLIDRIEGDYAEVMAGKYLMRRAAIREINNPAGRHGELAVLAAMQQDYRRRNGRRFANLLAITLPDMYRFHGSTGHATLLRDQTDGDVIQIHRPSVGMSEAGRRNLRDEFADKLQRVARHMGPYVQPEQTAYIGNHPFRRGARAVQIRQPGFYWDDPGIFLSQQPGLQTRRLAVLLERPAMRDTLLDFACRGLDLYEQEGLLIDVGRPQGVLTPTYGELSVLLSSSLPLLNPRPHDARRITADLNELVAVTS